MGAINWTLFGEGQGSKLEDFAALCLRRRFDAQQLRPGQGDGGIDVFKERPEGVEVWQVKSFTGRLDSSKKKQIRKSWQRFYNLHVETNNRKIAVYHLVTPLTPTPNVAGSPSRSPVTM